ncbi:GTP-binding protein 10-like [Acipenser ruthenus]|uniref:GTP-binding protein 10-like n=1 Tax=Acipenser ruthenus TaxID=7906 RepID=UPI00145B0183|nr:GTP-binding protein 10-like [Acipenser ruthenus]
MGILMILSFMLGMQYGSFVDNLRLYVSRGSGGMGLPRLGGQGGKGGDVWVVAKDGISLKKIKDKYPQKSFVAGVGTNSGYISVADLPGLIEAQINRGMGHTFLKHVEQTKQLLFVVDVQLSYKTPFRTAFEAIQLLMKELELYKEELRSKSVLAVNKMDLPVAEDKLKELVEQLQHPQDYTHLFPEGADPRRTVHFKHIIPVSASSGYGIQELKKCIRNSLEQATSQNEEDHREKLQELHSSSASKAVRR